jgi:hypothetical protein
MFCVFLFLLDYYLQNLSQEPDEFNEDFEDKRGTLLMMNFSVEKVEYAIRKLGM